MTLHFYHEIINYGLIVMVETYFFKETLGRLQSL